MKEDKNESRWDKLLNIRTMGRDDTHADQYRYPYEPTPYSVLERLANAGYIRKGNILLDYGCGKGRVDFFLSYQTRCKSIGIEYDERIYEKAAENKKDAVSSGRVEIELANAEEFAVPETADCMYFFNPFSVEILRKVMARILESYYAEPRRIQLFFYYPSDEYISYLMTVEELMFTDEIVCMDLFPGEDPSNTRYKAIQKKRGESYEDQMESNHCGNSCRRNQCRLDIRIQVYYQPKRRKYSTGNHA